MDMSEIGVGERAGRGELEEVRAAIAENRGWGRQRRLRGEREQVAAGRSLEIRGGGETDIAGGVGGR
jgi:hypothetical protein